jgi:mono/diheme cytochrome c family protein
MFNLIILKMKFSAFITIVIAIGSFILFSFQAPQGQKIGGPWEIPAQYKNKQNPHKGDNSIARIGRAGYSRHCRSCHGNNGQGDGPMAKQLKTFPGDFADAKFQNNHTDGDLYFMSFIGRDEMPNFESLITDEEERWAIVNYIRTFKK